MKGNRSRKEQEAYERLMKQQAELKEKQAAQKTKESQGYVAAGKKSAYEAAQNSTGSGRQGRKDHAPAAEDKSAGHGYGSLCGCGKRPEQGKGDYTGTWVNTAGPGGGTEIWKLVALNPGETAADYYEKKRRKHEEEQKEIDAAFRRALEETQEELREQRLGVAEGFVRKKRYNRNYEDLFGLPEGGDFRSRVEGTRGWDKLNGSEQYDRMVYIEEELKKREKEREKEEKIGYNGGKEKEALRRELFDGWNRQRAVARMTAEPQGGTGRETPDAVWSGPAAVKRPEETPEIWNGRIWDPSAQNERNPEQGRRISEGPEAQFFSDSIHGLHAYPWNDPEKENIQGSKKFGGNYSNQVKNLQISGNDKEKSNATKTPIELIGEINKIMDSDDIWRAQEQEKFRKEHWLALHDPIGGLNAKLASDQAIQYSRDKYGYAEDGTEQNALQHALWNALMTYRIGEEGAKKFADAHEILPGSQDKIEANGFPRRQNSEMDYYYNELGRKAALELMEQKTRMMPDGSQRADISIEEMMEYVDRKIKEDRTHILIQKQGE